VKGVGVDDDPYRPLIGDTNHRGSWQAIYNEDKTLALVLFEVDEEERFTFAESNVPKVAWEKPSKIAEKVAGLMGKLRADANPKLKADSFTKLERIADTKFERLSNDEVEEVGKVFHPFFDRHRIETLGEAK